MGGAKHGRGRVRVGKNEACACTSRRSRPSSLFDGAFIQHHPQTILNHPTWRVLLNFIQRLVRLAQHPLHRAAAEGLVHAPLLPQLRRVVR